MFFLHRISERNEHPSSIKRTLMAPLISVLLSTQCHAGHGIMNAFSDIDWLPEAGITPDKIYYQTDKITEALELSLTREPLKRFHLLASQANERLAEMDRMVIGTKMEAAREALIGYKAVLDEMTALVVETNNSTLADLLTNQLLENQYIISSQYMDYPTSTRNLIFSLKKTAEDAQKRIEPVVSASLKGSLFFKEEEIRWSWATAMRAEEQGL